MNYTTYILYSDILDKYYVGSTSQSIASRLKKHNFKHKGYTGKASDWRVVYETKFGSMSESRSLEKKIKGRGAKRYLLSQG